jgi:hypothetical protein
LAAFGQVEAVNSPDQQIVFVVACALGYLVAVVAPPAPMARSPPGA